MSSWRMARAVVPLTPTSSPRLWWLVSGGTGWVLLCFMELEGTQGRATKSAVYLGSGQCGYQR